jgi:hypothetical protein
MWNEEDGRDSGLIYQNVMRGRYNLPTIDRWSDREQFRMDIAMWYGQLNNLADQEDKRWKEWTIRKVFSLLYFGGLMVRRSGNRAIGNNVGADNRWESWGNSGPLASVISHTARVLVKLPVNHLEFCDWLWHGAKPQTRLAATHGVEVCPGEVLPNGATKTAKENKTGSTCNHFGINLALGGEGNRNPVSGNIIYPDGTHGHLYFALTKEPINGNYYLLIATEQSAPLDRYANKTGMLGRLQSVGIGASMLFSFGLAGGVSDQYGGKHGAGGHSLRACNGGQDWTEKYIGQGGTNRLVNYGPGPGESCYLDGMYIDLSLPSVFEAVQSNIFTRDALGHNPIIV